MIKRILIISAWSLFVIGVFVLTGFASRSNGERICAGADITIERRSSDLFVTDEEVRTMLITHGFSFRDQSLEQMDIPLLESIVSSHPGVDSCEVAVNVEGKVSIYILQRRPLARLINLSGESFYIDDRGRLMPWQSNYTAAVPVVNGYFAESFESMKNVGLYYISADSAANSVTMLDDIWCVMHQVDQDSLLRVQTVQLYVNPEKGFELIPRVGDHKIILGSVKGIEAKFRKLKLFYTNGLDRSGMWNQYSMIDLRYKNQVVCTKKPVQNGI